MRPLISFIIGFILIFSSATALNEESVYNGLDFYTKQKHPFIYWNSVFMTLLGGTAALASSCVF